MWVLFKNYLELCKPRVVMLMILTSAVGMCLAPSLTVPVILLIFGNLGIALVAGSAATLNHVADQHIDKLMGRTQNRPLVTGKITSKSSIIFALILGIVGVLILYFMINVLTAVLTLLSLVAYAICYTLYLKDEDEDELKKAIQLSLS